MFPKLELSHSEQGTDLVSPVNYKFLSGTDTTESQAFNNLWMLMIMMAVIIIMMMEKKEHRNGRKVEKFYSSRIVTETYRINWITIEIKPKTKEKWWK